MNLIIIVLGFEVCCVEVKKMISFKFMLKFVAGFVIVLLRILPHIIIFFTIRI